MSLTIQNVYPQIINMIRRTLTDSNPNKYNHGLRDHPFVTNLDRCNGSCAYLNDTSGRICVPNKSEDSNLIFFNMKTRKKEPKTLTKLILCKSECNVNVTHVKIKIRNRTLNM